MRSGLWCAVPHAWSHAWCAAFRSLSDVAIEQLRGDGATHVRAVLGPALESLSRKGGEVVAICQRDIDSCHARPLELVKERIRRIEQVFILSQLVVVEVLLREAFQRLRSELPQVATILERVVEPERATKEHARARRFLSSALFLARGSQRLDSRGGSRGNTIGARRHWLAACPWQLATAHGWLEASR